MGKPTYPRIRDADRAGERLHSEIDVTWAEGEPPRRFCGDNWCTGRCGLPALIIAWPATSYAADRFSKASGSQVACGPVMQPKRVEWTGERVEVPAEHRADLEKLIWF